MTLTVRVTALRSRLRDSSWRSRRLPLPHCICCSETRSRPSRVHRAVTTPSSVQAARGHLPGEPSVHSDPLRWKAKRRHRASFHGPFEPFAASSIHSIRWLVKQSQQPLQQHRDSPGCSSTNIAPVLALLRPTRMVSHDGSRRSNTGSSLLVADVDGAVGFTRRTEAQASLAPCPARAPPTR